MDTNTLKFRRDLPLPVCFFTGSVFTGCSVMQYGYNKKFEVIFKLILYICCRIYNLFVKMINILTHTKQMAFHAPITSGVYSVGFDVFTFSRPRRRPVC